MLLNLVELSHSCTLFTFLATFLNDTFSPQVKKGVINIKIQAANDILSAGQTSSAVHDFDEHQTGPRKRESSQLAENSRRARPSGKGSADRGGILTSHESTINKREGREKSGGEGRASARMMRRDGKTRGALGGR